MCVADYKLLPAAEVKNEWNSVSLPPYALVVRKVRLPVLSHWYSVPVVSGQ